MSDALPKEVISYEAAALQGYQILSGPYVSNHPGDRRELDRVIADMERGKIDYALLGNGSGSVCVARKKMKKIRPGEHVDIRNRTYPNFNT